MGDLLIRNVTDSMKADIRQMADLAGLPQAEVARRVLAAGLESARQQLKREGAFPPPGQHLREIFSGMFDNQGDAETFQEVLEEVRRGQARPLPFE